MSYYQSRIDECRKTGRDIRELGSEVAIVGGEFVLIGGDSPTAIELSGVTDEQASKMAELGREILVAQRTSLYRAEDCLTNYERFLDDIGAREVAW